MLRLESVECMMAAGRCQGIWATAFDFIFSSCREDAESCMYVRYTVFAGSLYLHKSERPVPFSDTHVSRHEES